MANMKRRGKVICCGSISQYDGKTSVPMKNLFHIVASEVTLQGFHVGSFKHLFAEAGAELMEWASQGKLKTFETYYEGLDKAVEAFLGLFKGANTGKSIVLVAGK